MPPLGSTDETTAGDPAEHAPECAADESVGLERVAATSAASSDRLAGVDHVTLPTVAAAVAMVVAAGIRFYRLGAKSVWLDEAFTWLFTTRAYTTPEILLELPANDVHPPLYYLVVDAWVAVAGTSEAALRFPSAVFGVAAVGLLYLLGAKLFDRWAGAVAAAVLCVSTFHVHFSQEARMYALLTVLTLVSYYFFVDLVEGDTADRTTIVVYVAATVLLVYTHVFGSFVLLAQHAYVVPRALLARCEWPPRSLFAGNQRLGIDRLEAQPLSFRRWVTIQVPIAVLAAPWWLTLLGRMQTVAQGGLDNIAWIPKPAPDTVWTVVYRYFFHCRIHSFYGFSPDGGLLSGLVFPAVTLLALALATVGFLSGEDGAVPTGGHDTGRVRPGPTEWIVLVWFLTLLAAPYVLSHAVTPILVTRYTICASLALFLFVGKGVVALRPYAPVGVQVLLVIVIVIGLASPLPTYYGAEQKTNWRDATASVESSAAADARIIVTRGHLVPAFRYYADRSAASVVGVEDRASRAALRAAVDGRERVWLVRSWTRCDDVPERLRSLGYETVETRRFRGIHVYRFVRED